MEIFHKNEVVKSSPKDFFLYFGVMVALYVSTVSIIALWFRIIDSVFRDPLKYFDPYSGGISVAIASLIVIFPIYLFISWVLHNDEKKNPEKREMRVRKWLIYLTLFIAGLVIVIDLIVLLNTFLSGNELTASFLSKVLVIFLVIGAVFAYYLYKVRKPEVFTDEVTKYLIWGASLFVLASVVAGFAIMGSPQSQREKRLDNERVTDLQDIQWQIISYWQKKEALPETLADLESSILDYSLPNDPDTHMEYTYETTGDLSFVLCANFARVSEESVETRYYYPGTEGENWKHDAGEFCFEKVIDPDIYSLEGAKIPVPVR